MIQVDIKTKQVTRAGEGTCRELDYRLVGKYSPFKAISESMFNFENAAVDAQSYMFRVSQLLGMSVISKDSARRLVDISCS